MDRPYLSVFLRAVRFLADEVGQIILAPGIHREKSTPRTHNRSGNIVDETVLVEIPRNAMYMKDGRLGCAAIGYGKESLKLQSVGGYDTTEFSLQSRLQSARSSSLPASALLNLEKSTGTSGTS